MADTAAGGGHRELGARERGAHHRCHFGHNVDVLGLPAE